MGNAVIYRPAYDAEVEYLESTGTQWIDTGVKPDSTYIFDCKVAVTQDNYNCVYWGTRNSGTSESENNQCYLNSNTLQKTVDKYLAINLFSTNTRASSNWSSNIIPSVNTMYELIGMTVVPTMNPMIYPVTLFAFNIIEDINAELGKCRIGYWKCYSNGVLVRDMIPVRIGSVGYMYDKVSKQLFANKGTGNFILGNDVSNAVIPQQRCVLYFGNQRSVGFERIYEEYSFLTLPYGGYIMVDDGVHANNSIKFTLKNAVTGNSPHNAILINKKFAFADGRFVVYYNSRNQILFFNTKQVNPKEVAVGYPVLLEFKNNGYVINNVETTTEMPELVWHTIGRVAGQLSGQFTISSIEIDNVERFVPCKLLQSIPAILDGNGIARQAGECGMWDKVNGKFYGNVANSGTFTVKGPKCYEEYKWLIGDNAAYIDTLILPAFGDELSATFTASRKPTVNSVIILSANDNINATSFTTGGDWYQNNRPQLLINNRPSSSTNTYIVWDFNSLSTVIKEYYMFMKLKSGELPDYLFKQDGITISPNWISGTNIITAVPTTSYKIGKGYSTITGLDTLKVRNITINNTNFVPCKLIHGIPASLDANGIARPAGTCGMWDKVNDKFYGNVGSGSFTVSNI